MAKISGTISNFANGISQQAMALRLATQGEAQVNGYSTVVDGLKKRPPTQRVADLGLVHAATDEVHTHMINRDENEQYEVLVSKDNIRVFDLGGEEKTVNAPNGFGYLDYPEGTSNPYRTLTVGDYTFVLNRSKNTGVGTTKTAVKKYAALINIKAGNYAKTYMIRINGGLAARYQTPEGTSAMQSPGVDASYIAARLTTGEAVAMKTTVNGEANGNFTYALTDKCLLNSSANTYADGAHPGTGTRATGGNISLNANGAGSNIWIVKRFKSAIYIARTDGAEFEIEVDDGYNGNAMKVIRSEAQDFSDLPPYAEDGMVVEIIGATNNDYDNYHVQFVAHGGNTSEGYWKEVPGYDVVKDLPAETMPHSLVREADGTFTFDRSNWSERVAGTEKTCPAPSFVDKQINDMVFFKNRLGFLAGENVILSRAGDYFNFWRSTATALLDDDPVDVASGGTGVSYFKSGVPFSDRLVLFSGQRQFSLMGNELLTPKTASIRETTAYSASDTCRPVANGDAIYFPVDRGNFTMIREFRLVSGSDSPEADDITAHVPQYIPKGIRKLAASTHEDILVGILEATPNRMYVYKYYWSGDRKLQSSWSYWEFPGVTRIIDVGFINSYLYMVVERGGEMFIERMEIQPGGTDPYAPFVCNLDRRLEVQLTDANSSYDPATDKTTIDLDHKIGTDHICVTAGGDALGTTPGIELQVVSIDTTELVLMGDHTGKNLYVGKPYEFRYKMSDIYLRRETSSGATSAVTEGRLQLLHLLVQFSSSAFFQVEVTPEGRGTKTYRSMGRRMGDPNNKTDVVTLNDGSFKVPIYSKNDRVSVEFANNSYLPSSILSAEWVATYNQKSRRI